MQVNVTVKHSFTHAQVGLTWAELTLISQQEVEERTKTNSDQFWESVWLALPLVLGGAYTTKLPHTGRFKDTITFTWTPGREGGGGYH